MYCREIEMASLLEAIERTKPGKDEVIMLLFSSFDCPDIPELIKFLNEKQIQFFGGIFPGLIQGDRSHSHGFILKKFKAAFAPFLIRKADFPQWPDLSAFQLEATHSDQTAVVLFDGMTMNDAAFLEYLSSGLGEHYHFIGAGAGFMDLSKAPSVFCRDGFCQDAAVVCIIEHGIKLGARHGWQTLEGPLVATKSSGNRLYRLNWQAAFEVYQEIVGRACGIEVTQDNFMTIAQGFPLGIVRERQDDIVRDPLRVDTDGSLHFIGEIAPNTVLHVLNGSAESLLQAAETALADCGAEPGCPIRAKTTFVVECVTRAMYLHKQFKDELQRIRCQIEVSEPEQEPFGVLSFGEIAAYRGKILELYNKTVVIGALENQAS